MYMIVVLNLNHSKVTMVIKDDLVPIRRQVGEYQERKNVMHLRIDRKLRYIYIYIYIQSKLKCFLKIS